MITDGEKLEAGEVPGFPGYYVTPDGRIIGRTGGWLKPQRDRSGHLAIQAQVDGRRRTLSLHRAVLLAWVGPPPEGAQACHNDGDPANNRVDNLRWDTHSANQLDRYRHAKRRL